MNPAQAWPHETRRNVTFETQDGSRQADFVKVSCTGNVIAALPIKSEEHTGDARALARSRLKSIDERIASGRNKERGETAARRIAVSGHL